MIGLFAGAFDPFDGIAGFLEGVAIIVLLFGLLLYVDHRRTRQEAAQPPSDECGEGE